MSNKFFFISILVITFSCKNKSLNKTNDSVIQEEKINVEESCGYTGVQASDKVYSFLSDNTTENYIGEIMKVEGLPQNFKIKAIDIEDNAFAIIAIEDGRFIRYIMYSQEFFEKIKNKTKTNFSVKSILAHEIGHHLCGHTLINDGSRPLTELEADRFSGFALRKMGASLNEALSAIKSLGDQPASLTHPSTKSRTAAIINGWKAADEFFASSAEKQIEVPNVQNNNNQNKYVICNMGNYTLALRNKILSNEELAIVNSNNVEAKSLFNAKTLVGIMPNNQEFNILEDTGKYLKIITTIAGQTAIGYVPSKVFGKKIYCEK